MSRPAPDVLLPAEDDYAQLTPARPGAIPHLGHTALLVAMLITAGLLVGLVLTGLLERLPLFRHESFSQLQTDPRVVIPLEAAMYAIAALLAWLTFPRLWHQPLLRALRWNGAVARRRVAVLAGVGVVVSICVQLLSNYLPIPKSLPIDKFFQNPVGIWIVALFGVTVAPFFEEVAFRGFLLPSLASAWDWIARGPHYRNAIVYPVERLDLNAERLGRSTEPFALHPGPILAQQGRGDPTLFGKGDPQWSTPALVFASIVTSIAFALLHAEQLAHAWAPLTVLFSVSLVLCTVRLRTHSLAASAFVHACYNGTIFILLFIGTGGFRHLDKLNG